MYLLQNPGAYISNINKHLAFESILADCQHGFRSQRSCKTQLVQFYHDIVSNLDGAINCGHKQTDLIIMDFAKAFDKVPHRRLLYKLDYYGIRGSIHRWISSWLSSCSQQVVLDGQVSDPVMFYLVFPKARSLDRSFSWYSSTISLITSGHLSICLLMIVSCIGTYALLLTVLFYKMTWIY